MSGALMIQGCGSDVGKSTLVAGLCRLFTDRGLRVRPFKPQNMSNNAAVTGDGGEIGRAQALQALACRTAASVDMNPVLLKPHSDVGAQLIVQGRMQGRFTAAEMQAEKHRLLETVLASYRRLRAEADLVLVEGAGSPAETNLRRGDIANMGFARAAGTPVALVGDIDRGHVIAALVGAQAVLAPEDAALICGFIVNKFRGDPALFDEGRREIVRRTGWRDFGMAPWIAAARTLPAEDAVVLQTAERGASGGQIKVVVPLLPSIANFDDFDPLRREPGVAFSYLTPGRALPCDVDLVVLPGSKAVRADLSRLREQEWDIDIKAHVRRGGRVLGVCGGYQMLGRRIADPLGIEGEPGECEGLGLLQVETTLTSEKTLRPVQGRFAEADADFAGYEIHVGRTEGADAERPLLIAGDGRRDGAISPCGRIQGAYVHGLFDPAGARAALLGRGPAAATGPDWAAVVERELDTVAETLAATLDIEGLARAAGL